MNLVTFYVNFITWRLNWRPKLERNTPEFQVALFMLIFPCHHLFEFFFFLPRIFSLSSFQKKMSTWHFIRRKEEGSPQHNNLKFFLILLNFSSAALSGKQWKILYDGPQVLRIFYHIICNIFYLVEPKIGEWFWNKSQRMHISLYFMFSNFFAKINSVFFLMQCQGDHKWPTNFTSRWKIAGVSIMIFSN